MIGYAVAGWLLLQVVNQFIDRALLPELACQLTLIWYIGLFPAVAVLGWCHGEKGRQRVNAIEIAVVAGLLAPLVLLTGNEIPIRTVLAVRTVEGPVPGTLRGGHMRRRT